MIDMGVSLDVDTARQLADLCEREATLARSADADDLIALAARLATLNAALPRGRHGDPLVRTELARALTAARVTGAVLQERLAGVGEDLRATGERATAARAYAASLPH